MIGGSPALLLALVALSACTDLPSVFILHTGGQIGKTQLANGSYCSVPNFLPKFISTVPYFMNTDVPRYTVKETEVLSDNNGKQPKSWYTIAAEIYKNYDNYDGFVVLSSTEALSSLSSALSFLFPNTRKPIIVTGSQIPIANAVNDGLFNLIGAVMIAGYSEIPEVAVLFGRALMRGNRVQMFSTWDLDAFDSANYPPLGRWGTTLRVYKDYLRAAPTGSNSPELLLDGAAAAASARGVGDADEFVLDPLVVPSSKVTLIRLYPGIDGDDITTQLEGMDGAVILAFGAGNGPTNNEGAMNALGQATAEGKILIDATQAWTGSVDLGEYATGTGMASQGVVSAYDMVAEAALAKLSVLFGYYPNTINLEQFRELVSTDWVGELTVPGDSSYLRS